MNTCFSVSHDMPGVSLASGEFNQIPRVLIKFPLTYDNSGNNSIILAKVLSAVDRR